MENKKIWLGILVMVLVLGITGFGFAQDSSLNGTWAFESFEIKQISNSQMVQMLSEIKILPAVRVEMQANRLMQMSASDRKEMLGGIIQAKYGSILRMINGNIETSFDDDLYYRGSYTANNGKIIITTTHAYGEYFDARSRWYSKDELDVAVGEELGFIQLNIIFSTVTKNYSVNGNKLIITDEYGTITYSKK
jgi:hypothetical protein